jgi:hypothetical protein
MKREMVQMAFSTLAKSDTSGALAQAQQMPAGPKRDGALSAVADQLADTDPAQAVRLVQGVKRHGFMDQIFSKWADQDLNAATQAAMSQLPNVEDQVSAMRGIAGKLSSNDPQAAITWMTQLPVGKLRDAAQESIAGSWAETARTPPWRGRRRCLPPRRRTRLCRMSRSSSVSPTTP